MTIYFRNGGVSWPMLAHEEIGCYSAQGALPSKEQEEALVHLGIDPADVQAHSTMKQLLQDIRTLEMKPASLRPDITSAWNPEEEDATGIYFIENLPEQILAVFKVGRKRACLELQARKIAHLLGLADTVVPGTFAVLQDAPQLETSGISEQLWNDREKVYVGTARSLSTDSLLMQETDKKLGSTSLKGTSRAVSAPAEDLADWFSLDIPEDPFTSRSPSPRGTPRARYVVGVLQPYLPQPAQKASCLEFLLMNITALAIGLRDGKNDGFRKATLIDIEDYMPVRIDPQDATKWQKERACTYLPYLDQDDRTTKKITFENLSALKSLVTSWNINSIVEQVKEQKIVFVDILAEAAVAPELDDGGYSVSIRYKDEQHPINGLLDRMSKGNLEKRIFSEQQIDTFKERLRRIKSFIIDSDEPFSVQDLVFAVDPFAKKFFDLIELSKQKDHEKRASPVAGKKLLRGSGACARDSFGPFHLIGKNLLEDVVGSDL